jgi:hypothetical protein
MLRAQKPNVTIWRDAGDTVDFTTPVTAMTRANARLFTKVESVTPVFLCPAARFNLDSHLLMFVLNHHVHTRGNSRKPNLPTRAQQHCLNKSFSGFRR